MTVSVVGLGLQTDVIVGSALSKAQSNKTSSDRPSGSVRVALSEPYRGSDVFWCRCMARWSGKLAIREANPCRLAWNGVMAILLIYTCTILPYVLCFVNLQVTDFTECMPPDPNGPPIGREDEGGSVIDWIVDVLFWIDLVGCFFFTYRDDHNNEVTSLRMIVWRYIRSSFLINLLASMPTSTGKWVSPLFEGGNQSTRIVPLIKLVRLLRLGKLISFMTETPFGRWLQTMRSMQSVGLTLSMMLVVHLMACGWYLTAALHPRPCNTWIGRRPSFPGEKSETPGDGGWTWNSAVNLPNQALITQPGHDHYFQAMYFVLVVFTSTGYGDISAQTEAEVVYCWVLIMVGAVVHSVVVSKMIQIVTNVDQANVELHAKQELVERFSHHVELSEDTTKDLVRCIARSKAALEGYDQEKVRKLVMVSLPDNIMEKLHSLMFKGRLARNHFVSACARTVARLPPRFPLMVALLVHSVTFKTGEMVYYWSDHAWNIFLVLEGTFAYVAKAHPTGGICEVPAGVRGGPDGDSAQLPALSPYLLFGRQSYFGEFEMFVQKPRVCSVRCEDSGLVLVISKVDFRRLADEFPDFAELWKSRTLSREGHRKASLKRLRIDREFREMAAWTIQRHAHTRLLAAARRSRTGDRFQTLLQARDIPRSSETSADTETDETPPGGEAEPLPPRPEELQGLMRDLRAASVLRSELGELRKDVRARQAEVRHMLEKLQQALNLPCISSETSPEWV